jgi:hypothetical protein
MPNVRVRLFVLPICGVIVISAPSPHARMKLLEPHTKVLLRHLLNNFLIVFAVGAVAVGLDFLEHLLSRIGASEWIVTCMEAATKIAFGFDIALLVCTMALFGTHYVTQLWRKLFRSDR